MSTTSATTAAAGPLTLAWAGIEADHIAGAARRLRDRATGAPA